MKPQTRFLLASAANAATTANAVRAFSKKGPGSVPSFVSGLVPSELPLQHGIGQAGFAALFARSGGTKGWRGRLGLALNAASGVGLAHLYRVAGQSGGVLEAALVDELGENYRNRISEQFTPRPDVPLTRRRIAAP